MTAATHPHGPEDFHATAADNRRRLWFVLVAGMLVMAVELAGGLLSGSLVLLADAGHYSTDIASVGLALIAVMWSLRPPTHAKSFGYRRAEVIAAFIQAIALWLVSAFFLYEAFNRLRAVPEVDGAYVLAIGAFTLVVNGGLAYTLHRRSHTSINVRAAYLHILSDVLGSAAAVVAGAFIYFLGWHAADPLLTLFVTVLILVFTWNLTKQSLHILLEGTPSHIDPLVVRTALLGVDGVREVHDLHIWSHSPGSESLTAHVVLAAEQTGDATMHTIHAKLRAMFGIQHATIQLEGPTCPCDTTRHDAKIG